MQRLFIYELEILARDYQLAVGGLVLGTSRKIRSIPRLGQHGCLLLATRYPGRLRFHRGGFLFLTGKCYKFFVDHFDLLSFFSRIRCVASRVGVL